MSRSNFALRSYTIDNLLGSLLARALAPARLTPGEFALVSVIRFHGPITPKALAARLGIPPTTLSAQIRRLVARRLVRRVRNPDDRRSYLVAVTATGRARIDAAVPAFRRALKEVAERLDRPLEEVDATLDDLERALRAVVDDSTNS